MAELTQVQKNRFARQIMLEHVGEQGQRRLQETTVVLVGVGGLGSPAALYLAGSGVGHLVLIDPDAVSLSNLHRQILYENNQVGQNKVDAALVSLKQRCDSDIRITTLAMNFVDSVKHLGAIGISVALDCTDAFAARYSIHEFCWARGIPLVTAAVNGINGYVTTLWNNKIDSPCFECLFPNPGQEEFLKRIPGATGVMPTTPGILGVLQAQEAMGIVLQQKAHLQGRLLRYFGHNLVFKDVTYSKDPYCPHCSPKASH